MPDIPGIDHPMVLSYAEAITGKPVGKTVAVVGAGGVGFDVSEFLVTTPAEPADEYRSPSIILKEWKAEWGAADPLGALPSQAGGPPACGGEVRGALTTPIPAPPAREVYLLQRTKGPQGKRLVKTSGWVHRASLKAKGVQQLSGANYERIDDDGLHISFGPDRSDPRLLEVDNVVICAGQQSFETSKTVCAVVASTRTSSVVRHWRPNSTPSGPSGKAPRSRPGSSSRRPI